MNSTFFDSAELSFTRSPASDDSVEAVVLELRSAERLFIQPGGDTRSILEEAKEEEEELPFEGSAALVVESEDPHGDFRRSMEEVAAAHGVRDWKRLEAMLVWYLRDLWSFRRFACGTRFPSFFVVRIVPSFFLLLH